jgi:hypothetical protein
MLAQTSPTSGGRLVGIVHSRTQTAGLHLLVLVLVFMTTDKAWIGNWIYWALTDRNYMYLQRYR